ncbi:MAG: DUF2203 domain-containing protein [Candidatus Rokubacteria bacterium]|nr:DUF2203 domain-containing protein [Candidatus Rokubacteria bacterium]
MADRHFSLGEVEALIPTLTAIMGTVMALNEELEAITERQKAERQRIAMSGGGVVDRSAWRRDSARIAGLGRDVEAQLARILELGGVPKDLRLGLVDFPHLRDGRIVNLCWKHGEDRIRSWHGLDEGYASRKLL